jgi:hypothetical protein
VSVDPELMKLAEAQAQAMASRDKLDHSVIRGFNDRLLAQGYRARTAAENIGAGYHTLAEAFSGWRDPPHRANMLLNGATRMGIAAVYAPKSKYKVFGADPRRARRKARIGVDVCRRVGSAGAATKQASARRWCANRNVRRAPIARRRRA